MKITEVRSMKLYDKRERDESFILLGSSSSGIFLSLFGGTHGMWEYPSQAEPTHNSQFFNLLSHRENPRVLQEV